MITKIKQNPQNIFRWKLTIAFTVLVIFVTGIVQAEEKLAYAQGVICTDRPANERGIPPVDIWVEVTTYYNEWGELEPFARSVPFDFYVSGVLLGELGDSPDDITDANLPSNNGLWADAALEAMAVAIRSFTWFRLNYAGQFPDPYDPHAITLDNTNQCGFWDEKVEGGQQINAQTFRPYQAGVSQTIKDLYNLIVTQHVPDTYMVEGSGTHPIDAQYRATVGEYSDDGGKSYLISIFDPISAGDTDPTNASGLGQWGAQRWAMGLNDTNELFPQWESYQQILTHYYTNIQIVQHDGSGTLTTVTPNFRWNILQHNAASPVPPPGSTFSTTVLIQNTGVHTWPLNNRYPLSYWWVDESGDNVTAPVVATRLTEAVSPGDITTSTLSLLSPTGGPYTLTYQLAGPPTDYSGAAWSQRHLYASNGRSRLTAAPPTQLLGLWQRPASNPFILNDDSQIYYQFRNNQQLEAYNLLTGRQQWQYIPPNNLVNPWQGVLVDPYYIAPQVLNSSYRVVALNSFDGQIAWQTTLESVA